MTGVAVEDDITAIPEGDQPLSKFQFHAGGGPADVWLAGQDADSLANGLDRLLSGGRIFVGQETVETLDIPKGGRRPNQP